MISTVFEFTLLALLAASSAHAGQAVSDDVFKQKILPQLTSAGGVPCEDGSVLTTTLERSEIRFFGNGKPTIRATFSREVSRVIETSQPGLLIYTVDFELERTASSSPRAQIVVTYALSGGQERLAKVVVSNNERIPLGECVVSERR